MCKRPVPYGHHRAVGAALLVRHRGHIRLARVHAQPLRVEVGQRVDSLPIRGSSAGGAAGLGLPAKRSVRMLPKAVAWDCYEAGTEIGVRGQHGSDCCTRPSVLALSGQAAAQLQRPVRGVYECDCRIYGRHLVGDGTLNLVSSSARALPT
ncbi:hypothetical protein HaLaN_15205, partial [Haematococcus lacustris]